MKHAKKMRRNRSQSRRMFRESPEFIKLGYDASNVRTHKSPAFFNDLDIMVQGDRISFGTIDGFIRVADPLGEEIIITAYGKTGRFDEIPSRSLNIMDAWARTFIDDGRLTFRIDPSSINRFTSLGDIEGILMKSPHYRKFISFVST